MNLLKVRSVVLCALISCAGTALLAQSAGSQYQSRHSGPVPFHLPTANSISEQAAALISPQATTAVTSAVNAASFQDTHSPGGLSILYGSDLALPLPTTIVTSVKANGVDAPILQSSPTQMTIQIPRELSPGTIDLTIRRLGQTVATKSLNLAQFSPGFYTVNGTGQGRAIAEDAAGVPITDSHPAVPGTMVSLFATGLGPTTPPVPTGQIPPTPLPTTITPIVGIGNLPATGVLIQLTNTSLGVYKVSFLVPAATGPGEQSVFLASGAVSNVVTIPVQGSLGPMPPTADSITPSSGSGSTQTFTAVFSDPNGVHDLAWGQILIAVAENGGGQPFCFIHYDRSGNGLWLYGDQGFFLGPVTPGTVSASLKNNACAVNTSGATFDPAGTSLHLSVPVSFKTGFAGSKYTYLRAYDHSEQDTGWVQRGAFTVTDPPTPALSVTPASGSGAVQTFTGTYPDAPGFTGINLGWAQMLFAVATDGGGQPFCLVHYDRAGNGLWLYGDSGFFLGPVTPGSVSSSLQNSACSIDTAGSSAANVNGALEWKLSVAFKSAILGARKIYLRTLSPIGLDTGFLQSGSWTIDGTPGAQSLTPGSGTAHTQAFTANFYDLDGGAQISWARIMLGAASNGGGQPYCLVHYTRATNAMYLFGSDGSVLGPVTPGSIAAPIVNSACMLIPSGSAVSVSGNTLTVTASLSFLSAIPASVQSYLRAVDVNTLDSGWQLRGSFNPVP
ncbi:hypothetical protein [Paludibaculum fermentans]|uniref:Uncharacterized protein n=1 Tax=Paludibaculum fermentans TaxID=1473598 RepID=A0A7S7NLQ5_PALFE|nr:hypothetical protein [Paludibaculum fermentans]QOY85439.1 hypothetical protein IRI77_21710 [Paludibaculum fermentans]